MALRVDMFVGSNDAAQYEELAAETERGEVKLLGFVSARDEDEDLLVDTLLDIARSTGVDLLVHGAVVRVESEDAGRVSDLLGMAVLDMVGGSVLITHGWLNTLAWGARQASESGRTLLLTTRYDRGGTLADKTDEFATAWAIKETE